jgi:hypothetical protein
MSGVLSDPNVELHILISNAREVFRGEPWDQVVQLGVLPTRTLG